MRQVTDVSGAVTLAKSYQPYGSVLASAGSGATMYGFTGEQTDGGTGLTYLRARYYAGGMGRFLTRDTWGGDFNRPTSYNRWLYGYGNPIRYTDPTGYSPLDVCGYLPPEATTGKRQCLMEAYYSLYRFTLDRDFGIGFTTGAGSWGEINKIAVRRAVVAVGVAFAIEFQGNLETYQCCGLNADPADAFRAVYGITDADPMTFKWNTDCYGCRPVQCMADYNVTKQEYWKDDTMINYMVGSQTIGQEFDCKPAFGYTNDVHSIEFASMSGYHKPSVRYLRQRNNVIHELGHAFNVRLGNEPEKALENRQDLIVRRTSDPNDVLAGFYYSPRFGTSTWMQSSQLTESEIFADQFLGWVDGMWANSDLGASRAQFMADNMSNWITEACAK